MLRQISKEPHYGNNLIDNLNLICYNFSVVCKIVTKKYTFLQIKEMERYTGFYCKLKHFFVYLMVKQKQTAVTGCSEMGIYMSDYDFTVMYKNEESAKVHVSSDHKDFSVNKILPDGMKQTFNGDKINLERIYAFLKSRCFEDGYSDLALILEKFNMSTNDPWEWNRKTHGVTWEDYYWIRFEGENIKWEDVKWRD